ncbi:MAG TPA: PepSY-like domain-containing protein [Pseudomonadota bacterium]|jgi:hypothetical protein|nr:PepSY-like domain-containing protein [Pseudomonadota bacterium]
MKNRELRKWIGPFVAACAITALAVPAQANESVIAESEVPAPVLAAVKKQYPSARLLKFEVESAHGKRLYEVKLRDGERALEAKLTAQGELLEEEEQITEKDLPEPVRKSLAASPYAKAAIKKIERVVHKDKKDQQTFEIKVTQGNKTVELLYDAAGKLLATEA